MSFKFNRRSFFRCAAVAILSVACAGMLAGCSLFGDSKSMDGIGTLSAMSATAKLTKIEGASAATSGKNVTLSSSAGGTVKATFEITNGASNHVTVNENCFYIKVYDKDGTTKNLEFSCTFADGTSVKQELTNGNTWKGTVTATLTGYEPAEGDTLTVVYRPRADYNAEICSWKFNVKVASTSSDASAS